MSKDNIIKRVFKRMKAGKSTSRMSGDTNQTREMMKSLLSMVENTDEVEFGCDEVFKLLDQYVELESLGANIAELLPLVKKHLDKCRDCREEYEALVSILLAATPKGR